jgi:hypothetical protein
MFLVGKLTYHAGFFLYRPLGVRHEWWRANRDPKFRITAAVSHAFYRRPPCWNHAFCSILYLPLFRSDFQSFVKTSKVSFWWCHWFEWPPWHGQMTSHKSSFNLEEIKTDLGSNGAPGPTQHFTQKMHRQNLPISKVFEASNDRPYDGTFSCHWRNLRP